MSEKEQDEIEAVTETRRLYELGYHLVPTVPPETIGEEVSKIKDILELNGGVVVSHEMPKMTELAYEIPKMVANKRTYYATAHFGWMRFQASPDKVHALQDALKKDPAVLRFIVFKTVEEKAGRPPKKMKFFGAPKEGAETKEEIAKPSGKQLSEAELEKTIEELVVE